MTGGSFPELPHREPHPAGGGQRLNWLRAGVLGAQDGGVSTAGLLIGVAASGAGWQQLLTAGMAGLVAGALSMGVGEYVSVSTQRDTEMALLTKESGELREQPEAELTELTELYQGKGLPPELAHEVAAALTAHDALGAHAETELGISAEELTNPWQAALASVISFTVGAVLPLLVIMLTPPSIRIVATVATAVAALALTGYISARLGGSPTLRAIVRNAVGGIVAMGITYLIGALLGTRVG